MFRSLILSLSAAFIVNFSSLAQVKYTPDSALSASVAKHQNKRWRKSDWIIPSSLFLVGGLIALDKNVNENFFNKYEVREERNEHFKNFSCHIDNYLQYTPNVAVLALSLCGVKGKNDLPNQLAILVKTQLLLTSIVVPLKAITQEPRPDSSSKNSFPSGHTTEAFAAATFLAKEYGHKNIWYSIGAYTVATGVGALRVLNNRHWISDVIAGAGIGILSTNIVYATHQHKWGKNSKNHLTISPTYGNKSTGVYLSYKF